MNVEPNPPPANAPGEKKKKSALALPLAFVPSMLLLTLFTVFGRSNPPSVLFIAFCGISLGCCLVAAIMLFRRRTVLAVLFGILFLLLNVAISFFFGCAAFFTGIK